MLTRRIIPCLDVRDGEVVKGVRFRDHVDDRRHRRPRAALPRRRRRRTGVLRHHGQPRRSLGRLRLGRTRRARARHPVLRRRRHPQRRRRAGVLHAGADKISVNSPALERPGLIDELAASVRRAVRRRRHRQPARRRWRVARAAIRRRSDKTSAPARRTLDWIAEAQRRGAGEIVLNCMGIDGVRGGYDIEQLRAVRAVCHVPLVASGGAGAVEHFLAMYSARRCRRCAGGERVSFRRDRDWRPQTVSRRRCRRYRS